MYSTPVFRGGGGGNRQMRQKARTMTLIGVLISSAGGQLPSRSDFYHYGRWEGKAMLPDLAGAAQLRASGIPAAGIQHISSNVLSSTYFLGKTFFFSKIF